MSGNEKNIPHYTAADIEKYLKGELPAAAMHSMEKAALEDPFLADAMEGMALHQSLPGLGKTASGTGAMQQDLADLNKRLAQRVAQPPQSVPLFLRYAAAVVILLAGVGITYYYIHSRDTASTPVAASAAVVMEAERNSPKTDTVSAAPVAAASAGDTLANTEVTAKVEEAKSKARPGTQSSSTTRWQNSGEMFVHASVLKKEKAPAADSSPIADNFMTATPVPSLPSQSPTMLDTVVLANQAIAASRPFGNGAATAVDKQAALQAVTIQKDLMYKRANITSDSTMIATIGQRLPGSYSHVASRGETLVFTGRVVDNNNNAIPGAALQLKNDTRVITATDANGYFNLKVPKRDSLNLVRVRLIGYEDEEVTLSQENRKGNIIQLQPQSLAMNEVVITGFADKRKEVLHRNIDTPNGPLSLVAVPSKGWPDYNDYLDLNKKLVNVDSTIKGNEAISFLVDRSGKLSSFKVEQSLSPAHDSVSIRMIRNGPSWHLLNNKRKARARVIIAW